MRALFDGKVKLAETITATNPSLDYPAVNIKHPWIARRFQSSTNSSVITITLDDTYSINSFFYGLHNATAMTVVLKNSGGSTIGTIVVSSVNDIGAEYFNTVAAVKTIEITFSKAAGGQNLYLGGFEAGVYYQMPNFLNAYPINLIDNSLSRKSRGGQLSYDKVTPLRAYEFTFRELLRSTVDDIIDNYNIIGKAPLFIDITEGDRTVFTPIYCDILEPLNSNKVDRRFNNAIQIQEAR